MKTRTQEVTDQIREMIVAGKLSPDDNLNEMALAGTLQISRTPIRDALNALAVEGFCEYIPNRGYFVRRFTIHDLLDAFDVRATLEGMACRVIAERKVDDSLLGELDRLQDLQREELYAKEWSLEASMRWHELNREFHFAIVDATGNRHLMQSTRQMRMFRPLFFAQRGIFENENDYRTLYLLENCRQAHQEHSKIVDALRNRESSRVEFLMREHIHANREVIRKRYLADQPGAEGV
jgi:GntR family transcriptional regulator of vanillate catabolism